MWRLFLFIFLALMDLAILFVGSFIIDDKYPIAAFLLRLLAIAIAVIGGYFASKPD